MTAYVLPCTRREWERNGARGVDLEKLRAADVAVTKDRWLVKNRDAPLYRLTRRQMRAVTDG